MTLVHEVVHVRQDIRGWPKGKAARELEAYSQEARWLLENPQYRPWAPKRYQDWTREQYVTRIPSLDEPAIERFVEANYAGASDADMEYDWEYYPRTEKYPWGVYLNFRRLM